MKCPFCIKQCSKCKEYLVANTINFHKHSQCKYGVQNKCKNCQKQYSKQNYEDNREYKKETSRKYSEEHKEEKRKRDKKYYEDNKNKTEFKEKRKLYREEHKDEISKKQKEYQEKNKEKIKKQRKEYYENNKEKLQKISKEYRENNPHIVLNNHIKRRCLEENQGKGITKEQWLEMMNFFDWKCAYSGVQLNRENRSIDHIIPLTSNGEHEVWNCVPMYMPYNSNKNTLEMLNWYKNQEYFSEERLNKIYEWVEYARNKWNNSK